MATKHDHDFLTYLFNEKNHKLRGFLAATGPNVDNFKEDYIRALIEFEKYHLEIMGRSAFGDPAPKLNGLLYDHQNERHESFMKRRKKEEEGDDGHNMPPTDMINSPPHYNTGPIECIDAIKSALGPEGFAAYCRGNILKYNWRTNHKAGVQDLKKARWYLERLIAEGRS